MEADVKEESGSNLFFPSITGDIYALQHGDGKSLLKRMHCGTAAAK